MNRALYWFFLPTRLPDVENLLLRFRRTREPRETPGYFALIRRHKTTLGVRAMMSGVHIECVAVAVMRTNVHDERRCII